MSTETGTPAKTGFQQILNLGLFNCLALLILPIFFTIRFIPGCESLIQSTLNDPTLLSRMFRNWMLINLLESLVRFFRLLNARQTARDVLLVWPRSFPLMLLWLSSFALPGAKFLYALVGIFGFLLLLGLQNFNWNQLPKTIRWATGFYIAGWLTLCHLSQNTGPYECNSISSVKANMHTLQIMVELYHQNNKSYPHNLTRLRQISAGASEPYWKVLRSPFSGRSDIGGSILDMPKKLPDKIYKEVLGFRFYTTPAWPGMVLYKYVSEQKYLIYGLDRNGKIILDKGSDRILTNN